MKSVAIAAAVALVSISSAWGQTGNKQPVNIVAAENFYGDVAKQIGGADVSVTSILSNPDEDPHLFEVSPSVGRNVSAAQIVIYSGIDYDPWMEKLLKAAKSGDRKVIVVADLVGKKTGDNLACLVRHGRDAGDGEIPHRGAGRGRPGPQGRLRAARSELRGLGEADSSQGRRAARPG